MNLRLAMRAQPVGAIPQPAYASGAETAGAAGTLIGGVRRNALQLERVDAAIGVVARDLLPAAVDDASDVWHRQRRFRDVGGEDDSRPAARCHHAILIVPRERSMQRQDVDAGADGCPHVVRRTLDFSRAGKKAEHAALAA